MYNFRTRNVELQRSLEESIKLNIKALDRLENWINRVTDEFKYSEDEYLKDELETLKYLKFTLTYLDKQYRKAYKQAGGKKVFSYE